MGLLQIVGAMIFGTEAQQREWQRKRIENRNNKIQQKALYELRNAMQRIVEYEENLHWTSYPGLVYEEQERLNEKNKKERIEYYQKKVEENAWADPNFQFTVIEEKQITEGTSDLDKQIKILELQKEIESLKASNFEKENEFNSK